MIRSSVPTLIQSKPCTHESEFETHYTKPKILTTTSSFITTNHKNLSMLSLPTVSTDYSMEFFHLWMDNICLGM